MTRRGPARCATEPCVRRRHPAGTIAPWASPAMRLKVTRAGAATGDASPTAAARPIGYRDCRTDPHALHRAHRGAHRGSGLCRGRRLPPEPADRPDRRAPRACGRGQPGARCRGGAHPRPASARRVRGARGPRRRDLGPGDRRPADRHRQPPGRPRPGRGGARPARPATGDRCRSSSSTSTTSSAATTRTATPRATRSCATSRSSSRPTSGPWTSRAATAARSSSSSCPRRTPTPPRRSPRSCAASSAGASSGCRTARSCR